MGVLEDESMVILRASQSDLKKRAHNLFPLIAFKNGWLVEYWDNIIDKVGDKLITFQKSLHQSNANIMRGIETARGGKVQNLTISLRDRAIKMNDVWILREVKDRIILTENRFTRQILSIPIRVLKPALRRVSLTNTIDISNELDYVVTADFPDSKEFLSTNIKKMKMTPIFWNNWRPYVEDRLSQLALVRRADVSASGTCLLAFYSNTPFAPPGVTWSVDIDDKRSKLLCLWFNSTVNLLQTLLNRKETRGAFLQLDEYVLEEAQVLNFDSIDKKIIANLLAVFNNVKNVRYPSILEQLEQGFNPRVEIDKAILSTLGFNKQEILSILPKLYAALAEEIRLLKQLMIGKVEEE